MSLLLYQKDSYTRDVQLPVVACCLVPQQQTSTSKKQNQSTSSQQRLAYIDLTDTVIYIESGGQPGDFGFIRDSRGTCFKCIRSEKCGDLIRHVVVVDDAGVVLPNAGEVVTVCVDWERRYDHMQQHTSQHLFSHLAMKHKGWPTVGWALHETFTSVELEVADVTNEDLMFLSDRVNDAIREHVPVTFQVVSHDKLAAIPQLRSRGAIPTEGDIRVVTIQGYDVSTCGGTHVSNSAELQSFRILLSDTEHSRKGVVRIFFLAGIRESKFASKAYERDKALSRVLCCPPDAFVGRCEGLLADNLSLARQRKKLLEQVARYEALNLAASIAQNPGTRVFGYNRPGGDMEFLQEFEAAVRERCGADALLLLTGSEAETPTGPGPFLLTGPADLVKKATPCVLTTLQGKGGGKGTRVQGKANNVEKQNDALEAIKVALV